jgi:hypothetical protein
MRDIKHKIVKLMNKMDEPAKEKQNVFTPSSVTQKQASPIREQLFGLEILDNERGTS